MPDTATAPPGAAPPTVAPRLLLKITEAAAVLALGRSTVYEMIQRGELPVVRIGKAVRVPADALRRWVDRLAVTGSDDAADRVAASVAATGRPGGGR